MSPMPLCDQAEVDNCTSQCKRLPLRFLLRRERRKVFRLQGRLAVLFSHKPTPPVAWVYLFGMRSNDIVTMMNRVLIVHIYLFEKNGNPNMNDRLILAAALTVSVPLWDQSSQFNNGGKQVKDGYQQLNHFHSGSPIRNLQCSLFVSERGMCTGEFIFSRESQISRCGSISLESQLTSQSIGKRGGVLGGVTSCF